MDKVFLKKIIPTVFNASSPSFYYEKINEVIIDFLKEYNYSYKVFNKGSIEVFIKGKNNKKVATSSHLDTLGLMVRSIQSNGRLNVVSVGGISSPTLDGEYCKILTRDNKIYSGTILSKHSSVHVYNDAKSLSRDFDNLEIRLDELVKSKEDVLKLGITNGCYVFVDPKIEIVNDFVKGRFLDDKICVCLLLTLLKDIKEKNLKLKNDTYIYFVNQEEVGHGCSFINNEIEEFVTLDMGCVGSDLDGNEYSVSICSKDAFSPYSYDLTNNLLNKAKDLKLSYALDIYPYYSSDVSAAWKAGYDFKGALIGPGVDASHSVERTHMDGLENTYKLIYAYLCE